MHTKLMRIGGGFQARAENMRPGIVPGNEKPAPMDRRELKLSQFCRVRSGPYRGG
jgi:hypothetical protein